jgi:N-dimethylarginine dimethylaminohydrolase
MTPIRILDETAPLEAVILGIAESLGPVPDPDHTYDPKSLEHVLNGTFPKEADLIKEMAEVEAILQKYGVEVFRPKVMENYNQVFSRDIAIVIEETLIIPEITAERQDEVDGIEHILSGIKNVVEPKSHERMEGGDVMPWKGKLFVGYSKDDDFKKYKVSRTNQAGVDFLKRQFPNWEVIAFELKKSDDNPRENALHLDCCFQPVGHNKAVIYRGGFKNAADAEFLIQLFGRDNVFEITKEEMYEMNSNFFSISPEVVISDHSFTRLNAQFETWGLKVEKVNYREVAKMEGLLRCTTMPLRRKYD